METGFRLVADDRVVVWRSGGNPYGKAPASLAGLIEVRGLGVVAASPSLLAFCRIGLVVELAEAAERMPDPETSEVAGVALPLLRLSLADPDLPLRLLVALRRHL